MEIGTGEPKAPPAEAPPACALPCAARGQMWIEHSAIRPNPGGPWRARVRMHRHALTCLGRDGHCYVCTSSPHPSPSVFLAQKSLQLNERRILRKVCASSLRSMLVSVPLLSPCPPRLNAHLRRFPLCENLRCSPPTSLPLPFACLLRPVSAPVSAGCVFARNLCCSISVAGFASDNLCTFPGAPWL